jgi:hypothetical protein
VVAIGKRSDERPVEGGMVLNETVHVEGRPDEGRSEDPIHAAACHQAPVA